MTSFLRHLFGSKSDQPKRWPVVQIEITSRCPSHCRFCPNKTLEPRWISGDLSLATFRNEIAPHLSRFELTYLQGWGEPLLHPQIWQMTRLACSAGSRVGFTTCGTLLDETSIARVLDEGVNILCVSFAGATPTTHDSLRVGSNFLRLVQNVERLTDQRARTDQRVLKLELFFLMQRANVHELPAMVRLAAALGADELVATNLTYTALPEQEVQRVFARVPAPAHLALVDESKHEAKRLGIHLRVYPLEMDANVLECDAQPRDTIFVNHRGEVAPCVYLGMPVRGNIPRLFEGEEHPTSPVIFGNVADGLDAIMESPGRAAFTGAFRARRASGYAALTLPAEEMKSGALRLPAAPEACRHCYKLYGV
jgi:MoaA/NifB/PqqE/SkfB family radical SAM enzyme